MYTYVLVSKYKFKKRSISLLFSRDLMYYTTFKWIWLNGQNLTESWDEYNLSWLKRVKYGFISTRHLTSCCLQSYGLLRFSSILVYQNFIFNWRTASEIIPISVFICRVFLSELFPLKSHLTAIAILWSLFYYISQNPSPFIINLSFVCMS